MVTTAAHEGAYKVYRLHTLWFLPRAVTFRSSWAPLRSREGLRSALPYGFLKGAMRRYSSAASVWPTSLPSSGSISNAGIPIPKLSGDGSHRRESDHYGTSSVQAP